MPDDTPAAVTPLAPVPAPAGLSASPASMTVTAAATMTAASLAPAIGWLLSGCPRPVPDGVSLTVAAVLIIAAHGIQKLVAARQAKRLAQS